MPKVVRRVQGRALQTGKSRAAARIKEQNHSGSRTAGRGASRAPCSKNHRTSPRRRRGLPADDAGSRLYPTQIPADQRDDAGDK
jgi:hypothetical protein